uniref:hypothetical protein n=1 Tax=Gemella haemolysans TaxID=1379 RepID=UPI003F9F07BE
MAADNLFVVDVYTKIENLGSESKVIHMFPDFLQFKMEKMVEISIFSSEKQFKMEKIGKISILRSEK